MGMPFQLSPLPPLTPADLANLGRLEDLSPEYKNRQFLGLSPASVSDSKRIHDFIDPNNKFRNWWNDQVLHVTQDLLKKTEASKSPDLVQEWKSRVDQLAEAAKAQVSSTLLIEAPKRKKAKTSPKKPLDAAARAARRKRRLARQEREHQQRLLSEKEQRIFSQYIDQLRCETVDPVETPQDIKMIQWKYDSAKSIQDNLITYVDIDFIKIDKDAAGGFPARIFNVAERFSVDDPYQIFGLPKQFYEDFNKIVAKDLSVLCPEFASIPPEDPDNPDPSLLTSEHVMKTRQFRADSNPLNRMDPNGFMNALWDRYILPVEKKFYEVVPGRGGKNLIEYMLDKLYPAEAGNVEMYRREADRVLHSYFMALFQIAIKDGLLADAAQKAGGLISKEQFKLTSDQIKGTLFPLICEVLVKQKEFHYSQQPHSPYRVAKYSSPEKFPPDIASKAVYKQLLDIEVPAEWGAIKDRNYFLLERLDPRRKFTDWWEEQVSKLFAHFLEHVGSKYPKTEFLHAWNEYLDRFVEDICTRYGEVFQGPDRDADEPVEILKVNSLSEFSRLLFGTLAKENKQQMQHIEIEHPEAILNKVQGSSNWRFDPNQALIQNVLRYFSKVPHIVSTEAPGDEYTRVFHNITIFCGNNPLDFFPVRADAYQQIIDIAADIEGHCPGFTMISGDPEQYAQIKKEIVRTGNIVKIDPKGTLGRWFSEHAKKIDDFLNTIDAESGKTYFELMVDGLVESPNLTTYVETYRVLRAALFNTWTLKTIHHALLQLVNTRSLDEREVANNYLAPVFSLLIAQMPGTYQPSSIIRKHMAEQRPQKLLDGLNANRDVVGRTNITEAFNFISEGRELQFFPIELDTLEAPLAIDVPEQVEAILADPNAHAQEYHALDPVLEKLPEFIALKGWWNKQLVVFQKLFLESHNGMPLYRAMVQQLFPNAPPSELYKHAAAIWKAYILVFQIFISQRYVEKWNHNLAHVNFMQRSMMLLHRQSVSEELVMEVLIAEFPLITLADRSETPIMEQAQKFHDYLHAPISHQETRMQQAIKICHPQSGGKLPGHYDNNQSRFHKDIMLRFLEKVLSKVLDPLHVTDFIENVYQRFMQKVNGGVQHLITHAFHAPSSQLDASKSATTATTLKDKLGPPEALPRAIETI